VEPNESEEGSKAGKAVSASEIGLTSADWEENQELEGFLRYPYQDQGDDRAQGLLHGRAEPDAARLNAQLLPCRGKARDRPVSRKVADFDIQHGGL